MIKKHESHETYASFVLISFFYNLSLWFYVWCTLFIHKCSNISTLQKNDIIHLLSYMNDKMKKKTLIINLTELNQKKNERCYHMHKFQIIKLALIVAIIKEKNTCYIRRICFHYILYPLLKKSFFLDKHHLIIWKFYSNLHTLYMLLFVTKQMNYLTSYSIKMIKQII